MLTLDTVADFSWDFRDEFFLETEEGNYIWSDPDYNGDNSIRPFSGNHNDWIKEKGIQCSRGKGTHTVRKYCGEDVKIIP